MAYTFCQDEKNIEDLKDIAENGISDLFEYGQDVLMGNSLSNGTVSDDGRAKTFAEKIKKEMERDSYTEEEEPVEEAEENNDEWNTNNFEIIKV